jgi:hypothetical protein
MSSIQLFSKYTKQIRTPNGGAYTMTTDNWRYVLLSFRGTEYGSALKEDAMYLCNEFFRQGCTCVSMLFDAEDVSYYLDRLDFIYEPFQKLFCFFNREKLTEAKSRDGSIAIYYPSDYSDFICVFATYDTEDTERTYRVYNDWTWEMRCPYEGNMKQTFGYVVNNGRTEFVCCVAIT